MLFSALETHSTRAPSVRLSKEARNISEEFIGVAADWWIT